MAPGKVLTFINFFCAIFVSVRPDNKVNNMENNTEVR